MLSNLYLHVAFDMWIEREYPGINYERFADDIVVHTMTVKQSRFMLERIRERLRQFKLELHPKKTKIVHCYKSSRRKSGDKTFPVTFDFLGYKFCPISIPVKGNRAFGTSAQGYVAVG
ncbi:reverse transcriptase domain-containing protein [Bacteroides sp. CR5/BHMF/2]|nr:reverse transcriptase domain-containing protein [Bacteroides sp. CR5/BHMF/2]